MRELVVVIRSLVGEEAFGLEVAVDDDIVLMGAGVGVWVGRCDPIFLCSGMESDGAHQDECRQMFDFE